MNIAERVWRPAYEVSLRQPLDWEDGSLVLIHPQLDIFHAGVSPSWTKKVYDAMAAASHHTFVVPTRHPHIMMRWALARPLRNVWLGVMVSDQFGANELMPDLMKVCDGILKFVWCEPLLGLIDLESWIERLGWVIAGGGTGMDALPVHPGWVRWLRDQCQKAGKPFFFRQWGEWLPEDQVDMRGRFPSIGVQVILDRGGNSGKLRGIDEVKVYRVGRDAAGNSLDGRHWLEVPGR